MITGATRERSESAAAGWGAAALVGALVIALSGTGVVLARSGGNVSAADDVIPTPPAGEATPPAASAPPGNPLAVRIPSIGVVATLVPLGTDADGTLEVPGYEDAGWYTGGSRPGNPGPAVIAAHVDSRSGPAVFYRLKELKPGDVVHVDYSAGTVSFAVRESQSFAKSRFPTAQVYGPTDAPELRLVTCDGSFDRTARSYTSNLVVWANAAAPA